jgi:hypothetical protein
LYSVAFLGASDSSDVLELDIETAAENFSDKFFKLGGLEEFVELEFGLGRCGFSRIGFDMRTIVNCVSHK